MVLTGKHILFLVENNSLPFDKRVWREAKTIAKAGSKVSAICPKGREHKKSFEIIDGIRVYRYNAHFATGSKWSYLYEYAESLIKMFFISFRIFLRSPFRAIHTANPPDTLWIICLFYKIFGVKFIFDEHDLSPESYLSRFKIDEDKPNLFYKVQYWFQVISYKLSNAVISTNESYKKTAIERGNLNPDKVFVVRNGPDTREFNFVEANNDLKDGFSFLACYIGVMAVQDGLDHLIYACDNIVNKFNRTDILFKLIGKGDEFENLQELTESLGLTKYIKFMGRLSDEDATAIMSTADVGIAPDPYNPLNDLSTMNKIMEYMICRSPVVSYDLTEAKYSAQDAAVFVEKNNIEAFAKAIIDLMDNSEKRTIMSDFGYKRVVNELSWENQEKKLIEVYHYI